MRNYRHRPAAPDHTFCALKAGIFLCLASLSATAQSVLLSPAGDPAISGTNFIIYLTALNESREELRWTFPETVSGRLSPIGSRKALDVQLTPATNISEITLNPGAFARAGYLLPLPARITGQVLIAFPAFSNQSLLLDIQTPPSPADIKARQRGLLITQLIKPMPTRATCEEFVP